MLSRIFGLACIAFLLGSFPRIPALAQVSDASRSPYDIEFVIEQSLAPGLRANAFIQRTVPIMGNLDVTGDGVISDVDLQFQNHRADAAARAVLISRFISADFNDDGVVSRDELAKSERAIGTSPIGRGKATSPDQLRDILERRVAYFMRADADYDGRIDWSEMVAFAKQHARRGPPAVDFDALYKVVLGFDANNDGRVTREEFSSALQRKFAEMDSDGDGLISQSEFDGYWQRRGRPAPKVAAIKPSYREKLATKCAPPRPSTDARFILFISRGATALSSAAIGSQEAVTQSAKIIIEPGDQKLYLVVIGWQRVIWRLEGDLGRIEHLVLAAITPPHGQGVPAGVTGISKNIVTFAGEGHCQTLWVNMTARDPTSLRQNTELLFGRAPDEMLATDPLQTIYLPSGRKEARSDKPDWSSRLNSTNPALEKDRLSIIGWYPGGVVDLNSATVVAGQPMSTYEVLPQQAGLLELQIQGALTRDAKGVYIVQKPMRFPAELAGAHAVQFFVPTDVPMPMGNPGHSKVTTESDDASGGKP